VPGGFILGPQFPGSRGAFVHAAQAQCQAFRANCGKSRLAWPSKQREQKNAPA